MMLINSPVSILKDVDDTGLVQFNELIPAADGSFWITAQIGIAKVHIEPSELSHSLTWNEYYLPNDYRLSATYSSPFVDENGKLFVMGIDYSSRPYKAILLRWDGISWELLHVADDYNMYGIPCSNDSFFIIEGPGALMDRIGNSTLARVDNGQKYTVKKGKILSGNLHASAVDRGRCCLVCNSSWLSEIRAFTLGNAVAGFENKKNLLFDL